jgi:hypothetical protein
VNSIKYTLCLITGLILSAYLKENSIDGTDEEEMKKAINEIIDPDSFTGLTVSLGHKLLNEYSFAGVDILDEMFPMEPRSAKLFAKQYMDKLESFG